MGESRRRRRAEEDAAERQAESRRILERVGREGDIGSSFAGQTLRRTRDHFAAADADDKDAIEVWGTRIGRLLALVFFLVLVVWLIGFLTRG